MEPPEPGEAIMTKPAPTLPADLAMATLFRFHPGHARRVSESGDLCLLITGRKAKTNREIIAAIEPLIAAGLLIERTATFAPKGCPGGRGRPSLVDVAEIKLTPAGIERVAELAHQVDARNAAQAEAKRQALLGRIAPALAAATPDLARRALVFGELNDAAALQSASLANLVRVARTLGA